MNHISSPWYQGVDPLLAASQVAHFSGCQWDKSGTLAGNHGELLQGFDPENIQYQNMGSVAD
jgi:hypothetical protein